MKKDRLENITKRHYNNLKKHVHKATPDLDAVAIHEFRVEYKKLRAFLGMLSVGKNTTKRIKVSKDLKQAYNVTGTIRDRQLQQLRVVECTRETRKKPQTYLNLLQQQIDALQILLFELLSRNPVSKSKKKTDASLPEKFLLTHFRSYVQDRWNVFYTILESGNFSDNNIHLIRKNFKDMFYNLKQYEGLEYSILSVTARKGITETYFEKLLAELGDFNDLCNSIALLRSEWLISFNTYNRNLLQQLKKEWIRKKILLKKILIKKIKTDLATTTCENNKKTSASLT